MQTQGPFSFRNFSEQIIGHNTWRGAPPHGAWRCRLEPVLLTKFPVLARSQNPSVLVNTQVKPKTKDNMQ